MFGFLSLLGLQVFEALLLEGQWGHTLDHLIKPLDIEIVRSLTGLPVLDQNGVELAQPVRKLLDRMSSLESSLIRIFGAIFLALVSKIGRL